MIGHFVLAILASTGAAAQGTKGVAVAYPWVFSKGTDTAHETAIDAAAHIAQRAGYAAAPESNSKAEYSRLQIASGWSDGLPSHRNLEVYGRAMHADIILYGMARWHTRSLWVGSGPKTISSATVSVFVYDTNKGRVVYHKSGVQGRSDEKENGLKDVADVLLTPLVTAVSGGPATPREQRAVQIALGIAYSDWVHHR